MHVNLLHLVSIVTSGALLANALPLNPQNHDREGVWAKRNPYLVVPVDGGAANPISTSSMAVTVTQTVLQSSENVKTVTVPPTETVTVPSIPSTETVTVLSILSTETVIVPPVPSIETVTIPPILSTVTVTKGASASTSPYSFSTISIVDAAGPIESISAPSDTTSISTSSSMIPVISGSSSAVLQVVSKSWITIVTSMFSQLSNSPGQALVSSINSTSSNTPLATSTSTTYDNGQWHTFYPLRNSTSTATIASNAPLRTGYNN